MQILTAILLKIVNTVSLGLAVPTLRERSQESPRLLVTLTGSQEHDTGGSSKTSSSNSKHADSRHRNIIITVVSMVLRLYTQRSMSLGLSGHHGDKSCQVASSASLLSLLMNQTPGGDPAPCPSSLGHPPTQRQLRAALVSLNMEMSAKGLMKPWVPTTQTFACGRRCIPS